MSTATREAIPADVQALEQRLGAYLPQEQIARVRQAYQTGARAGDYRRRADARRTREGEPRTASVQAT